MWGAVEEEEEVEEEGSGVVAGALKLLIVGVGEVDVLRSVPDMVLARATVAPLLPVCCCCCCCCRVASCSLTRSA